MPKPKRPHVASPDEIRFTRNGDEVIVEYADPTIAVTHLRMEEKKIAGMTDEQLLAYWNEHVQSLDEYMRDYEYVAVEVPVGKPQVRYFEDGDQWVPRGSVLRCELLSDSGSSIGLDDPFLTIDGRDFTLAEFVKMVGTFGGWGMRIEFVPDDELHERPEVEVGEPEQE